MDEALSLIHSGSPAWPPALRKVRPRNGRAKLIIPLAARASTGRGLRWAPARHGSSACPARRSSRRRSSARGASWDQGCGPGRGRATPGRPGSGLGRRRGRLLPGSERYWESAVKHRRVRLTGVRRQYRASVSMARPSPGATVTWLRTEKPVCRHESSRRDVALVPEAGVPQAAESPCGQTAARPRP